MPLYAAFLRGVNLGPTRKVSGAELRAAFEQLGFGDVATFRTSGNVVFEAEREPRAKLNLRIERGLADATGFEVPVFLRTAAEVRAIAEHEPFDLALVEARGKLQVALLSAKPSAGTKADVLAEASEEDRLAFDERELYWLPSGGTRDAGLDLRAIERLVGDNTMRTKGTIEQLAAKHLGG